VDDATLQSIYDLVQRRWNNGSTHYEGCVGEHVDCAMTALLYEVQRLRGGIRAHKQAWMDVPYPGAPLPERDEDLWELIEDDEPKPCPPVECQPWETVEVTMHRNRPPCPDCQHGTVGNCLCQRGGTSDG
jgi:hypothetical protein